MIPFLDLKLLNQPYQEAFKSDFQQFLDSGYYILGNQVRAFEKEFAQYCGANFCIGVGNGLDALKLILRGYMELGRLAKGDKVMVAANTYIATILAIKEVGLEPLLVEPNENTFNLDTNLIQDKISPKTKAILVTHLYGQRADMKNLSRIALKNGLLLLADAAQSHGARNRDDEGLGDLADATGYSFYPTKNLGALGDGGAVTTDDKQLTEIISALRNYGSIEKYKNDFIGYNSRLDEVQAAFLRTKLKDLEAQNERRRNIARRYFEEINNEKVRLPYWDGSENHVFHLFVTRVKDRTDFCTHLKKNQIGFMVHYPIPPHRQYALPELAELELPITEKMHREVVSIPLNPTLTDQQINKIIEAVNDYGK